MKAHLCVDQPALFIENVEQAQLPKRIRLPDDIEILLGLSQHAAIENVERFGRGVPMLPCGFHFERDRRLQMLAQGARTNRPRGRRLDVAEVPAAREEWDRHSETENVVPVPQRRCLPRRSEPVQIPEPFVPECILSGERDVWTALRFGQADFGGTPLFVQPGGAQVGSLFDGLAVGDPAA